MALLLRSKKVDFSQGYYYFVDRQQLVAIRQYREDWSKAKIKRAKKIAKFLSFIPWIKLIGITGALAMKNADKKDDIDLFFITSKDRVWLSRGVIVLILRVSGLYRRPNKKTDMICPNMFVAEDRLKMGPEDLFIAHEIVQMKPIFDRGGVYQKFLKENRWVKKFLPNAILNDTQNMTRNPQKIFNFQFSIFNLAEALARRFQLWYMSKKRTTEVVSENLIKFHPQDVRGWVLKEYQERLQKLKIS